MTKTYATTSPTTETYATIDQAFDFFNKKLFSGVLGHCLITLQRKSKAAGYHCHERFESRGDDNQHKLSEIALNPATFRDHDDVWVMQTLVHEMCHLWQYQDGKPPRTGYHNTEWAAMIESIGLMPSDTGKPGGKRTGSSMSDFVIKDGPFDKACTEFLQDKKIAYQDAFALKVGSKSKNKARYTCPKCGLKGWGKPEIKLACGQCWVLMKDANSDEGEGKEDK
jgi:predicted SprT family Zn-dependent metalloprotease